MRKCSDKNKSVWTMFKCMVSMATQMRFKKGDVPTFVSELLPFIDY